MIIIKTNSVKFMECFLIETNYCFEAKSFHRKISLPALPIGALRVHLHNDAHWVMTSGENEYRRNFWLTNDNLNCF
jgi:UPF0288 family protein (methanogenesis marker protein 3)